MVAAGVICPKAEDRPYHAAHKAKKAATARTRSAPPERRTGRPGSGPEWVVGRNAVLEALTAAIPTKAAYVAEGAERLLVGLAVVRRDSGGHRLELDDHGPGQLSGLVGLLGQAASHVGPAGTTQRRSRQLGVRVDLGLVADLPVDADPVGGHAAIMHRAGPGGIAPARVLSRRS